MTNSRDEFNPPTSVTLGGSGVLKVLLHMQLTGAGDFGRERGDTTLQKTKLHINPTNTFFFFATSTKYFHKHIFFGFSLEKKHWVVGLIEQKFSCQSWKYM